MAGGFKPCSVTRCNANAHRSAHGRNGYCTSHYQRFTRHGDVNAGLTARGEAWRFAQQLVTGEWPEECVPWPYTRDTKGYGHVRNEGRGKPQLAHRLICALAHGEPPTPEHHAAHSCGKGHLGCCNPAHVRWATPAENLADKRTHGTHLIGERAPRAKLKASQVREIRQLLGSKSKYAIAQMFGVSQTAISAIQKGKTWQSVE